MPFLPDDHPDFYGPDSASLYRTLGAAYGRLHGILADFDGPIETWEDNAYDLLFKHYVPEALPKVSGEMRRKVEGKRSVPMQRGAWRCVGRIYRVTELACGRSEGAGWL